MSHEIEIVSKRLEQSSGAGATAPPIPLPPPRVPIEIRVAREDDLAAIDALQKPQTKRLGFMPTKALEGKIRQGQILVAEENRGSGFGVRGSGEENGDVNEALPALNPIPDTRNPILVGYLIGSDQYFKRDDVGIIYQINVAPGKQRGFIGAALLKAQFERSAYGCRLYCCWCAQDIEANRFWEAMGFVPLAFRAGSEKKQRVHIYWCKRIREGDTTTAWWFPSQTKGGSMMEDRLVFPIPPGTHWSDAKPIVLPRDTHRDTDRDVHGEMHEQKQIEAKGSSEKTKPQIKPAGKPVRLMGGMWFTTPEAAEKQGGKLAAKVKGKKPVRQRQPKIRNNPTYVAAARELRDRWLEQVNAGRVMECGKYAVGKQLGREGSLHHGQTSAGSRANQSFENSLSILVQNRILAA